MLEKENIQENNTEEQHEPFFTRSRILFLIVVFIVMCIPLIYRYLSFLL